MRRQRRAQHLELLAGALAFAAQQREQHPERRRRRMRGEIARIAHLDGAAHAFRLGDLTLDEQGKRRFVQIDGRHVPERVLLGGSLHLAVVLHAEGELALLVVGLRIAVDEEDAQGQARLALHEGRHLVRQRDALVEAVLQTQALDLHHAQRERHALGERGARRPLSLLDPEPGVAQIRREDVRPGGEQAELDGELVDPGGQPTVLHDARQLPEALLGEGDAGEVEQILALGGEHLMARRQDRLAVADEPVRRAQVVRPRLVLRDGPRTFPQPVGPQRLVGEPLATSVERHREKAVLAEV